MHNIKFCNIEFNITLVHTTIQSLDRTLCLYIIFIGEVSVNFAVEPHKIFSICANTAGGTNTSVQ
jgi:hypothetical protein